MASIYRYRKQPIPWGAHAPTANDYKFLPVNFCDPRSAEDLVDLAVYGVAGNGFYARADDHSTRRLRRCGRVDL